MSIRTVYNDDVSLVYRGLFVLVIPDNKAKHI